MIRRYYCTISVPVHVQPKMNFESPHLVLGCRNPTSCTTLGQERGLVATFDWRPRVYPLGGQFAALNWLPIRGSN